MAEKEYIEREALKALFDERYETAFMQMHTTDNREHWKSYSTAINWGRNTIADAPTADVVEVVHAEWEPNPYYNIYYCSKCGRQIEDESGKPYENFPYCHCGAKMEEIVND